MLPGMKPADAIRWNQEVRLSREQIGRHIDQFELVEGAVEPEPKREETEAPEAGQFTIKHKGAGKYDVLSSADKKMNENPLTKEEAEALADQLNQQEG